LDKESHEVATPWGFLGLRVPTRENVLAIIDAYGWVKENAPYELLAFSHMTVPKALDAVFTLYRLWKIPDTCAVTMPGAVRRST